MAKLEITVDVADEGIPGKIAKVEEARGALNATRVDQIREILTDAGVELPEVKKAKQQRIECCYDALDDIEQRIKEHVQERKAKDHKQEVLELEYTAVVELMRQLSDERKAGGRK